MKKFFTLVLSALLPGIGHITKGRVAVGIAFFLSVVTLLDCIAYLEFSTPDAPPAWKETMLLGLLALVWLGCQAHLLYLLHFRDPARHHEEKELAFREGLRYYLLDELPSAIRQFERVLRIDPFDCDACFHLAVCLSRAGMYGRAIRRFKKCTELDDTRKWSDEIQEEIQRARDERKQRKGLKAKAGRD